ncbi:hypothetical protein B0H21DRAFT_889526 [Amylocystis lapponica]|nr:hypothetical protein B0H21DRAFT_889526 [Amylocystis lapponica]
MGERFVQVELEELMDNYVRCTGDPPEEDWQGMFDSIEKDMSETEVRRKFMEAITKKNILGDDYKAISLPSWGDPSDPPRYRPDAGVYPTSVALTHERTIWEMKRLSVEFRKEQFKDDPFDDDDPLDLFEATCPKRQAKRFQSMHSASEIFLRQHRCFLYSVIILGTSARIVRWDRSGAMVTRRLDSKEEPQTLCDFLWYFGRMSAEDQGYDPSAVPVAKGSDDYDLMDKKAKEELPRDENNNENVRDYVRRYFKRSLADGWQRFKVEVPLDEVSEDTYAKIYGHGAGDGPTTSTGEEKTRTFLICKPHFSTSGVVGRGTRGYVAIDCATKDFVFLKDTWRIDLPDTEREGDVLQTLNKNGVRNIPTVLCHGDILAQYTETQNYEIEESPARNRLKTYCHYRLVEKEVGQALEEFYDSQDLVSVVVDCLFAHSDAVEKAGILHRDISSGNLLMVKEKWPDGSIRHSGLLNDWELSKEIPVGTWQFLSAMSLNDKYKQIVLQDDLESFFHVLLYMAIQYLPSNCPDVDKFIESFFDGASITDGDYTCGSTKMYAMENGKIRIDIARERLQFYLPLEVGSNNTASPSIYRTGPSDHPDNIKDRAVTISGRTRRIIHPINIIFTALSSWFSAYYEERSRSLQARDDVFIIPSISALQTVAEADDGYGDDPQILAMDPETIEARISAAKANLKDTKSAENLASHGPMIQLLRSVRQNLQKNDKVDVRAVQARNFANRNQVVVPAALASIRSPSKRDYPDPEREVDAPPLKRPRISQNE